MKKEIKMPKIELKIYQQDFMPGFAAYVRDKNNVLIKDKKIKANLTLNIGSFIVSIIEKDIKQKDLPYYISETIMHEITHVLEDYFKVKFSERKIHKLTEKYYEKYGNKNKQKKI